MGLSTIYGNIVMFALVLTLFAAMAVVFSDYVSETSRDVRGQGEYLKERLDTTIRLSSVTTSGNDVIFYVTNDGRTNLDVNQTDFYIDRKWVNRSRMQELRIMNTTFYPGVWNPDEWVFMRTNQYPIDAGDKDPHEGRVVAENGVLDSMIFYKTD